MKENHAVVGILSVLISALILGTFAQTGSDISGAATASSGMVAKTFGWLLVFVVLFIAGFAVYKVYFKEMLSKGRSSTSFSTLNSDFKLPAESKIVSNPESSQLTNYVSSQRANSVSDSDIRSKLKAVGWKSELIDDAFR